jgi:plasmid maintenance system antidote protein VapI
MSKFADTRQWLVDELTKKGWGAQSALAAHLGLHRTAVNKMKDGVRDISADELAKMMAFFGSMPPGFAVPERLSQASEASERRFTKRQPAQSQLDDAMWAIWGQAKTTERQLIINIANTTMASRKGP